MRNRQWDGGGSPHHRRSYRPLMGKHFASTNLLGNFFTSTNLLGKNFASTNLLGKTSLELRMLSPSLFIQGSECKCQYCCSQLSEM